MIQVILFILLAQMAGFVGAIGYTFIAYKSPTNAFTEGIKWNIVGYTMVFTGATAVITMLLRILETQFPM